jgi:hypothetical protein
MIMAREAYKRWLRVDQSEKTKNAEYNTWHNILTKNPNVGIVKGDETLWGKDAADFLQKNANLISLGPNGLLFTPQNPTVVGLVNQTFANKDCQDFMNTVLNNASSKANPVLESGDIQKLFADFLGQRKGGISRDRLTKYGSATGRIGTNGSGNGTLFLPLYKVPIPNGQDWLDASGIVNELSHIAGSKGGYPNYNQYDDYALAQAVHNSPYDSASSFTGNKNPFTAGVTDRADPRWSNYFHDILRKKCVVPVPQ